VTGRSPSGRATHPTDQAPARLGDTASVPNAERTAEQYRQDAALFRARHNHNAANALDERAADLEALR
jgi:hypothetical protein